MADIELIIKVPKEVYKSIINGKNYISYQGYVEEAFKNGIVLPKGHGRLKDEDEIVKAIIDRTEFLKKNDATFMRLHKDIDILGCIPKIRCCTPTILEADMAESGE